MSTNLWTRNKAWIEHCQEGAEPKLSRQKFNAEWAANGGAIMPRQQAEIPGATILASQAEKPPTAPPRPLYGGSIPAPDLKRRKLTGKKFVFTSAQNNTELHEGFWAALNLYCQHNEAELIVSTYTYNINAWEQMGGQSKDGQKGDGEDIWYDPRIRPYVANESLHVARSLVFCGELDILPTARTPLSGLEDYTGTRSGIIPHAKMQLRSLATMKGSPMKLLYTTGTVTTRNYIERKVGQVATFHHVFGALVVEIDDEGDWFARQINADDTGAFYDLGILYKPDSSITLLGNRDCIVNLGDIHIEHMDEQVMLGALDMLKALNPKEVFLHDILDFKSRNHHNIDDPYFLAEEFQSRSSVQGDLTQAGRFARGLTDYCDAVQVVRSNHDQAFKRWLKEADGHYDPINAYFWHFCNARMFKAIGDGDPGFDIFEYGMQILTGVHPNVHYIKEDQSVVRYNIEFGMHGHRGPNGAKGSPRGFRQLGRRANTGHTHSAGIIDGIYTAGILSSLDLGYNTGPSSWTHSSIVTYPNGKRQIITQRGNKWRA